MDITGLIKEHFFGKEAIKQKIKSFDQFAQIPYTNEIKEKIRLYFNNGHCFSSSMILISSLIPKDNKVIGGINYYTDGKWIWPGYLAYYVENYNIAIDNEFLNVIINNSPKEIIVNQEDINQAIRELKEIL